MNKLEIKRLVYSILTNQPDIRIVNDSELVMRCRICGDSDKNMNKKRLYFKIDLGNADEPIFYKCMNCNESGIVTSDFMKEYFDLHNLELLTGLRRFNKQIIDNSPRFKYKNESVLDMIVPEPKNVHDTVTKIKYFYTRIGMKIPISDFAKLKIVFSIKDFLELNKLEPNISSKNNYEFLRSLEKDYMGFLSRQNNVIVFRDVTGNGKLGRYYKYKVIKDLPTENTFYTVNTNIDILTMNNIEIIAAEGTFDTISVLYNIYEGNTDNKIFLSTCNGAFLEPLKYYINKGFLGDNVNINIYQDNDTLINFNKLKSKFSPYINEFRVFSNGLYKDFGVPKDNMEINRIL